MTEMPGSDKSGEERGVSADWREIGAVWDSIAKPAEEKAECW